VKTKVLPHKGRADLAGSNEVRRSREDMCSVKVKIALLLRKYSSLVGIG
jgi:targeting protein for Xklp2